MDGNLQVLVIEGTPSQKEIAQAWENILVEYIDAIGTNEQKAEIRLRNEVEVLQASLLQVTVCIEQLSRSYHPDFAEILNIILKCNFKFDPNDQVKYHAQLKNCYNRSRSLKVNLDLKLIQYEAVREKIEKDGSGQPYTHQYFASMMITLSDFAGYQLSDNITTFDYCDRLRRLIQYNEDVKRRNANQKKQ